jgi:hypothetical protein
MSTFIKLILLILDSSISSKLFYQMLELVCTPRSKLQLFTYSCLFFMHLMCLLIFWLNVFYILRYNLVLLNLLNWFKFFQSKHFLYALKASNTSVFDMQIFLRSNN